MVNPTFSDGKPTMSICGNDNVAKGKVVEILGQFGCETEDMGKVEAARAIEPLCMLWRIPGLLRNEWGTPLSSQKFRDICCPVCCSRAKLSFTLFEVVVRFMQNLKLVLK